MSEYRFENAESAVASLKTNVDRMLHTSLTQLTREDQLGEANFSKAKVFFEAAKEIAQEVARLPLNEQPPIIIKQLEQGIGVLVAMISKVQTFSLTPSPQESEKDPIRRRNNILNELKSMFDSAIQSLYPVIGYLKTQNLNVSAEFQETKEKAQEFVLYLEDKRRETLDLIESVKKTAQLAGVVSYAGLFGDEARRHRNLARAWLIFAVTFAATTAYLAWKLLLPDLAAESASSDPLTIAEVARRLVVISVLLYGAVWCTKNYSSHRHNQVINQHRYHAFQSFQAFTQSATDSTTQATILLQATKSIFEHQPSGYLTRGGASQASTVINEVIDRVNPKSAS